MCNQSKATPLGKENDGQIANCNQTLGQLNGACKQDRMDFDGGGDASASRQ